MKLKDLAKKVETYNQVASILENRQAYIEIEIDGIRMSCCGSWSNYKFYKWNDMAASIAYELSERYIRELCGSPLKRVKENIFRIESDLAYFIIRVWDC